MFGALAEFERSLIRERTGRASRIILNGVSVARRTVLTSRSFASPAWAPSAAPTSCDSEVGMPRGSVVYFTRFHTPSTTAPLDVVGFVYFNSSSVSEVMFRF